VIFSSVRPRANCPRQEIVDAQRVLSALMADSYRSSLWAAAYVINGGCSDDGFDYFRAWLMLQGRETFGQAVADPDSLADLAAVRLAITNQAIVECESALYIPARGCTGQRPATRSLTTPIGWRLWSLVLRHHLVFQV